MLFTVTDDSWRRVDMCNGTDEGWVRVIEARGGRPRKSRGRAIAETPPYSGSWRWKRAARVGCIAVESYRCRGSFQKIAKVTALSDEFDRGSREFRWFLGRDDRVSHRFKEKKLYVDGSPRAWDGFLPSLTRDSCKSVPCRLWRAIENRIVGKIIDAFTIDRNRIPPIRATKDAKFSTWHGWGPEATDGSILCMHGDRHARKIIYANATPSLVQKRIKMFDTRTICQPHGTARLFSGK